MNQPITDKNFLQRAFKAYDNPHCVSIEEFQEDLQRFTHIKKILTQYTQSGEINDRLLLNHIVISFNLFGRDALLLLLHRVDQLQWRSLFPFLIQLDRLPDFIPEHNMNVSDVELDQFIVNRLREL